MLQHVRIPADVVSVVSAAAIGGCGGRGWLYERGWQDAAG